MKIVIIDDEPKIRKGMSKIISLHPGWVVMETFADAESALAYLQDVAVDVVITDIRMPGMLGLDLIEQLKASGRDAAFVILSGYGRFEYAQRAIDLGVKKFLTKPTSPQEVTQALEQIEGALERQSQRSGGTPAAAAAGTSGVKQPKNLLILRAQEYIDLHYRTKVTLSEVAAALYISPNYLSDLFKKHTGMKFSDYLLQVRMEKSREYLLDVHYKIGDVSSLVGFTDSRYFSSAFRKHYGMSPLEFRNQHAAGELEGNREDQQ